MGKRKLLLSGSSVAELRKECEEFLRETAGTVGPEYPYPPAAETGPDPRQLELPLKESIPATVATYPTPTQSITTTPAISSDRDKRGVPWDARVHSSNREMTVKGSWRKRRGVEDSELERVEAELLRGSAGNVSAPVPVQPPATIPQQYPAAPVAPPVPVGNAPAVSPAPVAPTIPSAIPQVPSIATTVPTNLVPFPATQAPSVPTPSPTPPPAAPVIVSLSHNLATFKANMPMVIAELVKQGKIGQDYIAAVKQSCNVQEIWQMNETQIGEWFELLCQHNLINRMP